MPIEMTCKTCGEAYTPSRSDLIKGPAIYRYCEQCRPVPVVRIAPPIEDEGDAAA